MDDGIVPLPASVDIVLFESILQGMDDNIQFTLERAIESLLPNGALCKMLSYLDASIIHHEDGNIETDVYYKETNSHDYLDYHSHHPPISRRTFHTIWQSGSLYFAQMMRKNN